MPLGTGRTAGQTITAADINGIATEVNLKLNVAALLVDTVDTSQATTSTSYTDLTTVGPTVVVTVGTSGRLDVTITADVVGSAAGVTPFMSFALSGANTLAASDVRCVAVTAPASGGYMFQATRRIVLTGLTPGSTTITAKYRVGSGSGTFRYRQIAVDPR